MFQDLRNFFFDSRVKFQEQRDKNYKIRKKHDRQRTFIYKIIKEFFQFIVTYSSFLVHCTSFQDTYIVYVALGRKELKEVN